MISLAMSRFENRPFFGTDEEYLPCLLNCWFKELCLQTFFKPNVLFP